MGNRTLIYLIYMISRFSSLHSPYHAGTGIIQRSNLANQRYLRRLRSMHSSLPRRRYFNTPSIATSPSVMLYVACATIDVVVL